MAGSLYAALTPAWQAPDEPAHYNYIRHLAGAQSFPELVAACYDQAYLSELTSRAFPPGLSVAGVCYEYHQPPLYYLLATPFFIIGDGTLFGLRLFSVLLGGGVVTLAYVIARTIFPGRQAIALGTMALVAFVPMHLTMLASVNNDALAELLLALILLLLVRRVIRGPSFRRDLGLGLVLGLGLLAKTTVYIGVPLAGAALLLPLARRGSGASPRDELLKPAFLIFGAALLLALPWYGRNLSLYGGFDLLGLRQHDAVVVGQLRTPEFVAEVGPAAYAQQLVTTTFRSFWGQFGWMAVPMDGRTYRLLAVLSLLAGGGLLLWLAGTLHTGRLSTARRQALTLLGLATVLAALGYAWYNFSFVQFQGRYLFPSLIPLSLFATLGLREIVRPRRFWWLNGGLALALLWLGLSSWLAGDVDRWAILIISLFLGLSLGRLVFPGYKRLLSSGLLLACYAGLALLALASPFWFIRPYL